MGLPLPPASDEYFAGGYPPLHQQVFDYLTKKSWGGIPRMRTATSLRDFDSIVDEYITSGYEVLDRSDTTALVKKKTWGSPDAHLIWAFATFWTMGIGNLAYALFSHINAERVVIRLDPRRLT